MDRTRGGAAERRERRRREARVAMLRASRAGDAAPVPTASGTGMNDGAAPRAIGGERALPLPGQLPRPAPARSVPSATAQPSPGAEEPARRDPWNEPWDPDRPSLRRRMGSVLASVVNLLVLVVFVGGLGFALGGFLRFFDEVEDHHPMPVSAVEQADGIVVLTGASYRLAAAGELLAAGRAEHLLVSGVNLRATEPQVRSLLDVRQATFACCVELGFEARDTIGNAREAAGWFGRLTDEANGALGPLGEPRLIVVTSNYHMPRALHELGLALPDVSLVPYPVKGVDLTDEGWWRKASHWRLLVGEYGKLILARAREYPALSGLLSRVVAPAPANG